MRLFVSVILLFSFFLSCKKESRYPGYSQSETGTYFRLLAFGDTDRKPIEGNYLEMYVAYKTINDSLFSDSKKQNAFGAVIIPLKKDSMDKKVFDMFTMLNEGDSASFIVNAEIVFNGLIKQEKPESIDDDMKLEVMLRKIMTHEEYLDRLNELKSITDDMDIEEQRILNAYLKKESIETGPIGAGIYYIPVIEGNGAPVEADKIADLSYKGYFLNGEVFDSTRTDKPFEYFVGVEDQLIRGLEEGLSLMKEGSKAKFIIPSHLAFGDMGSSTGIVPPYTTVIYEVNVIKVY